MQETTHRETKIYGYCRISTPKQSIDRQVRNILKQFSDARLIEETYTGTSTRRPKWDRLKKQMLAESETCTVVVIFDSVSRMSRNADEGFQLYQELYDAGIEMVFLKEPHINSATYKKSMETTIPVTGTSVDILLDGVRRYLMVLAKEQIRIAFEQAQKEVDDLHKRTSEGMLSAKLSGKQIGRVKGRKYPTGKQRRATDIILNKNVDFGGSLTDSDCIRLIGCSRNSYYKYKRMCRDAS